MNLKNIYFVLFLAFHLGLNAQSSAPLSFSNEQAYNIIDRLRVLYPIDSANLFDSKPYLRRDVVLYAFMVEQKYGDKLSKLDREDLQYLYNENNMYLQKETVAKLLGERGFFNQKGESIDFSDKYQRRKPIWKHFYPTQANWLEVNRPNFQLRLNVLSSVEMGKDSRDTSEMIYHSQQGARMTGSIDNRIFFETDFTTTQSHFAQYANDYIRKINAVPNAGLFKPNSANPLGLKNVYDYLNATGLLSFKVSKSVNVMFGHGKTFVGDGMRSLFLSDFANNYLHLKLQTKIWRFNYENIFAEVGAINRSGLSSDNLIPKKYIAMHTLNYNINKHINIGIFESVVFKRNNNFELQYLNPVILYRSVEHALGSPDNAMLGASGRLNFSPFSFYGQFFLDEFLFNELIVERRGWWANKFGFQIGGKYANAFGIKNLDLQAETNWVRPFTYSHVDSATTFAHQFQPLAHPVGANFKEYIFRLKYTPLSKLRLESKIFYIQAGEDKANESFGNNVNTPNNIEAGFRKQEYGYFWLTGVRTNTTLLSFDAQYQVWHNGYLYLNLLYRKKTSTEASYNQNSLIYSAGYRLNINRIKSEY